MSFRVQFKAYRFQAILGIYQLKLSKINKEGNRLSKYLLNSLRKIKVWKFSRKTKKFKYCSSFSLSSI